MLKQGLMKSRNQWRALAAGRHVAAPEVGNHRNLGDLGNDVGVADLQGKAVLRAVADGLPNMNQISMQGNE